MFRLVGATKRYGGLVALDAVDLSVRVGEVLVLVGPNGAGKTTLTKLVATLERADAGRVELFGTDPWTDLRGARRRLSVVPQNVSPDPMLTPWDHVYLYLRARGTRPEAARRRTEEVLERFGLAGRSRELVHRLSGGYQRRVVLAMAVAADGDLLLLDEPTVALDPLMKRSTWNLVTELSRRTAVLLTTHDMGEAEAIGSRVAVLDGGRIVEETTVEGLRAMLPSGEKVVLDEAPGLDIDRYGRVEIVGTRTVLYPFDSAARQDAIALLSARDVAFSVRTTTLEDVYVHLLDRRGAAQANR